MPEFSADRIALRKQSRWRRLVDTVLCPYFHGDKFTPEALEIQAEEIWRDHSFMMDCFADKICDIYKPGDIIMIHDYHLMMLPRLLRRRLPDAYLTFSLHTPYRTLAMPWPLKVLEGILGSNIITLQASEDMMAFVGWCAKKYPDQSSYWAARAMNACAVLPTGIDMSSVAQGEAVNKEGESLRSIFKGRKIVVSYNTLDTGAEMEDILLGFNRMLTQMPQWKKRVIFLQVICTSRAEDSFGELSTSLFDELTDSISAEYGPAEFGHVLYYKGQVSELEFHALLRISDAAIFPLTPGGPMTAAIEYFICRPGDNKRPIVSEINPVTRQIPEPITYRRGDLDSIARAISYALELPDRPLMGRLHLGGYNFGNKNTAEHWTNSVLLYLTEKLLSDYAPADTSDTGAHGSCSPEERTEVQHPDDGLRGRDRSITTGDDGRYLDGRYYDEGDYDEGDYEGDYTGGEEGEEDEEDENDGDGNGREEDSLEGDAEPEDSEDSEDTAYEEDQSAVERLVTRSVEFERMGGLREAWAGKMPATL
ncbi:glycosyltransferase family 20 protein [Trichoderma evansii]